MKTYKVVIERDEEGAWNARVPSVPHCYTYGRTLEAARRNIREALGLWVRNADRAHLEFDIRLPLQAREVIRPVLAARSKAEEAQIRAQAALSGAARELTRSGFSLRDAGDLLGVSHQRIAQVVGPDRRGARRKTG